MLHDAGAALANEAIARGGLKSGDRAIRLGPQGSAGPRRADPGHPRRAQDGRPDGRLPRDRRRHQQGPGQRQCRSSPATSSAHPDVKAMFIDHGNLTSTIPTYMKAANLAPGSVYMAGFDASAATVQGIKDGYISLVIDQQQYLQGFLAVEQLCLTKQVRVQRPVREHRRRLHRQVERRLHRSARRAADPVMTDDPAGPMSGRRLASAPGARRPRSRRDSTPPLDRPARSVPGSSSVASRSRSEASTSSSDVDFRLGHGRGRRACSATTGRASRRSSRSSPASTSPMRARSCFNGERVDGLDRPEGARAGRRDGLPGASAGRAAAAVAEHLHGSRRSAARSASSRSARCARPPRS